MGKRILITGHRGFVGKFITKKLADRYQIFTLGNIDIKDTKKILNLEKCDLVLHLAAKTSIENSFSDPLETYYSNTFGTLNILEYCRLFNIEKLIFVSTYVYGTPQYLPIDESHPLNPSTPYNKSKLFAEELCKAYHEDFDLKLVILRPFYLYGPGQNASFLIPSILEKMQKKASISLSDPNIKRDFLFIEDFYNVIKKIIEKDYRFEIFNIGSGKSTSIAEVVRIISHKIENKSEIRYIGPRKGEIWDMRANINKIRTETGWRPNIDLEEGIDRIIEYSN